MKFYLITFLVVVNYFYAQVSAGAIQVKTDEADNYLGNYELVFLNFYANWCRFSQMLEPVFDEFADKVRQEIPSGKVLVGKVDCDQEGALATKNGVNKYPTLKLFRHGVAIKKEYRGARSVDAFLAYIKEQIADSIKEITSLPDLFTLETKKRTVIGYFANKESENYKTFTKLASMLRDSCHFVAAIGDAFTTKRANGDSVVFRNINGNEINDAVYDSAITNYETLYAWSNEKCTPLVREITFENAEELTEEGLPFVILFHKPDDLESVKLFEKEVQRQLIHEKNTITAVHADGTKFSHPLTHLGKSAADLPLLAIDSFKHMFVYPDFKTISEGNNLKQFILDLHSEKLHRDFHNMPTETIPTVTPSPAVETTSQTSELKSDNPTETSSLVSSTQTVEHIPRSSSTEKIVVKVTSPAESIFIKLAPGTDRYSFKTIVDEL